MPSRCDPAELPSKFAYAPRQMAYSVPDLARGGPHSLFALAAGNGKRFNDNSQAVYDGKAAWRASTSATATCDRQQQLHQIWGERPRSIGRDGYEPFSCVWANLGLQQGAQTKPAGIIIKTCSWKEIWSVRPLPSLASHSPRRPARQVLLTTALAAGMDGNSCGQHAAASGNAGAGQGCIRPCRPVRCWRTISCMPQSWASEGGGNAMLQV